MAKQQNYTPFIIGGIAVLLFMNGGFNMGGSTPAPAATDTGGCEYAPTFELRVQDKWSSTLTGIIGTGHSYKVNGGSTQTYTTAVTANKGDTIDVLFGAGNTTVYGETATYTISKCGLNQFPAGSPLMTVQNASVTIECFDENNDIINDVANNFTIGSGGTANVPCRMSVATAQRGIPKGGVMVIELSNGTTYIEGDTAVSGSKIGGKTSVPGAFTLAGASNKAVAYSVDSIMDTAYYNFNVYVAVETGQDPLYPNDITVTLYGNDCYENSDTGAYECGVEDEDSAWTHNALGAETISVD